jgi:phenylalanyl-tRNA synthetase beta chain
MIVSSNWLRDYVPLDMSPDALADRLTMSGFNLEGVSELDGDTALDLEITSNRPDCLGHIGVAREISVLFDCELSIPEAKPATSAEKTSSATSATIECEDLCPQYFARVIHGVKVGPSPGWLRKRLEAVGVASINNVVDVTNYVMLECGQPLHAFDLDKLAGRRIVVRRAKPGEVLVAIDHNKYPLSGEMCVIADANRPVAIGGVMGGMETEISASTSNLLIETADFIPLSIRNTARKLGLRSDSSYRFERGVDPAGLDWASRRCCELILKTAGGRLLDEPVVAGKGCPLKRPPIALRFAQIPRILGIDVPPRRASEILVSLGLKPDGAAGETTARFTPPSWRRDLEREADLIEEVARIHGYDKIPDDVPVPLELSARTRRDRVADEIGGNLTACGFYEAITFSFVSEEVAGLFLPRGERPFVRVDHRSWKLDNILRQTLVPSMLLSLRENERHGVHGVQLFEIAKVYLDADPRKPEHESEPVVVGMVSGRTFGEVKGVIEQLVARLDRGAVLIVRPLTASGFVPGRAAELDLGGRRLGFLGEVDRRVTDKFDLRDAVIAAELDFSLLVESADLIPEFKPLPQYPPIERDLNFVLDEDVTWESLTSTVRKSAGPLLEEIKFGGQYRGQQIGAGKKSYLLRLSYRAADRTLTSDEVEAAKHAVIEACERTLKAQLRA